jgi:hypothetical protein
VTDQIQLQFVRDRRHLEGGVYEMPRPDPTTTGPFTLLGEAKWMVERNAQEGVGCPCCGRWVKEYRRKLNAGMTAALIWLVGEYTRTGVWVNVQQQAPKSVLRNREIGKLQHWKMVENSGGRWRPTQTGIDFVNRLIKVQSHVLLLDNNMRGFSGELVSVDDALSAKFDYDELMGSGEEA